MALNDMGKVFSAIAAGRSAASGMDYGPMRTIGVTSMGQQQPIADYTNIPDNPDAFIIDIHACGSTKQRIVK